MSLAQRCHVSVVSNDRAYADRLGDALNRCAQAEDNRFQLAFASVYGAQEALELAASDPCLQAMFLDAGGLSEAQALGLQLQRRRAELDLFLIVDQSSDVDGIFREVVHRTDENYSQLYRLVQSSIGRRARTPFADTLRDYVYSAKDAWHTPGHSGGDSLRESPWVADFHELMGEHVFNTDLSVSVPVLDSLLEPHSVIQEAQDLAAEAFGARRSFFVTNGTSTANKVIMQYLLGSGGKIILDQACHKSVHHAVILYGAEPIYLAASVNETFGFYGPVPRVRVIAAIDANPDARLLVLTSCTYDGFYYDLDFIISYAHQRNIKVLVDEAWYAHGRFHPAFRPTAVECGADYVTQSTHKMLSAFSQASMIHVSDPEFDEHRFREDLNMHTSTSPQYAMIASLDVARKQASLEGFAQLSNSLQIADQLREGIGRTGVFRVLELDDMLPAELVGDGIRLDACKLSIDTRGSSLTAPELQMMLFEDYGIQVEKITHNTLTVLVTLGSTASKVHRLLHALEQIARKHPGGEHKRVRRNRPLPPLADFDCLPRDAYFGPASKVPLVGEDHGINPDLLGATCADQVVPYPPGIPVLIPGQRIGREVLSYLLELHNGSSGIEIHGLGNIGGEAILRVVDRDGSGHANHTATTESERERS